MKLAILFVGAALAAGCIKQNAGGVDGAGRTAPYAQPGVANDAEGLLGTPANPFEVDVEWPFAVQAHRDAVGTLNGELGAFVDAVEIDGVTWYGWLSAEEIGPDYTAAAFQNW